MADVRDPGAPCVSDISFIDNPTYGQYAVLAFWESYDPDDENVVLWRSDNNGENWYNFTESTELEWDGTRLYYYCGELGSSLLLQLEVLGIGESNVVLIYPAEGSLFGNIGGDRDGGDRVVTGKPGSGYTGSGDGAPLEDGDDEPPYNEDPPNINDLNTNKNNSKKNSSAETSPGESQIPETQTEEKAESYDSLLISGPSDSYDIQFIGALPEPPQSSTDSGIGIAVLTVGNDALPTSVNGFSGSKGYTGSIPVMPVMVESASLETEEPKKADSPLEWDNTSGMGVSGKRLASMILANPERVTFAISGIQVSVAADALAALMVTDNQLFAIFAELLADNSFKVLFQIDNAPLSEFPFIVFISEKMLGGIPLDSASCIDEQGGVLYSEYDFETGILSISCPGSGVFTLIIEAGAAHLSCSDLLCA